MDSNAFITDGRAAYNQASNKADGSVARNTGLVFNMSNTGEPDTVFQYGLSIAEGETVDTFNLLSAVGTQNDAFMVVDYDLEIMDAQGALVFSGSASGTTADNVLALSGFSLGEGAYTVNFMPTGSAIPQAAEIAEVIFTSGAYDGADPYRDVANVTTPPAGVDADGDGLFNNVDADSDGDGIGDQFEAVGGTAPINFSGLANNTEGTAQTLTSIVLGDQTVGVQATFVADTTASSSQGGDANGNLIIGDVAGSTDPNPTYDTANGDNVLLEFFEGETPAPVRLIFTHETGAGHFNQNTGSGGDQIRIEAEGGFIVNDPDGQLVIVENANGVIEFRPASNVVNGTEVDLTAEQSTWSIETASPVTSANVLADGDNLAPINIAASNEDLDNDGLINRLDTDSNGDGIGDRADAELGAAEITALEGGATNSDGYLILADTAGLTLDFNNVANVSDLEYIDMQGDNGQTLALSADDLLSVASSGTLLVFGDALDTADLDGFTDTNTTREVNGTSFGVHTGDNGVELLLDEQIETVL